MHDSVIRGGLVVDGSGAPARHADLAIDDGVITEVGDDVGVGRRTIDADGLMVTPGVVDIHTHYDGQVTWDPEVTPSSWHGVTTIVMGNCGVGFAPADPAKRQWLIQLMEGVEDIPGTALDEGMTWNWETFPEYLDEVERMPRVMDVAAQIPHGAVRAYIMGDRGAENLEATEGDIAEMSRIVEEGLRAGAVGFSTTRTVLHRAKDGELAAGTLASAAELTGIGEALGRAGAGVFEIASDMLDPDFEFAWMRTIAERTGRPVSFACLENPFNGDAHRRQLELADQARADGLNIVPQVAGRPACVLFGWESTAHPFIHHRTYQALAGLPFEERIAELRKPEVRRAMLDEEMVLDGPMAYFLSRFDRLYPLGDPPDYEPSADASIDAIAKREGRTPYEVTYDMMMQLDGRELIYFPVIGYAGGDFGALHEMLDHPGTVLGLGDGGAHCGLLCDASLPTYMLTHWVRDRSRGDRLGLEQTVRLQSRTTAELYGLLDRGLLAPGYRADVNVLDFEGLGIEPPEMVYDLPAGGRRLIQRSRGYVSTIVAGDEVYSNGEATGVRPGRLVRGAQPSPA